MGGEGSDCGSLVRGARLWVAALHPTGLGGAHSLPALRRSGGFDVDLYTTAVLRKEYIPMRRQLQSGGCRMP